ncbi:MAG TPA: aspartate kinase, partial [Methanomassiliicoccales archaeon]|nr:aspartate kinase [Methanomassiliicoccales archaeon]
MIKVMKFGGTSVGSPKALGNLANIVSSDLSPKALVVSAMSGVTNSLLAWTNRPEGNDALLESLRARHVEIMSPLVNPVELRALDTKLRVRLGGLRQAMEHYDEPESRPAIRDAIASWGERLSSLAVASLLSSRGIDAVALTSEEAGMSAMGRFGNGAADLDSTTSNFRLNVTPLIQDGKTPVITGYYGIGQSGRPITFGRGGSDYSGAVVAYALDADTLDIWTDVDGFMTADPRIVPTARTIEEMDYSEAAELAYFGAKVLHPRTIEPARRKGIEVLVRNTFNPTHAGTRIHDLQSRSGRLLKSVAVKPDLSIIKLYSAEIAYSPGLVTELLDMINREGTTAYAVSTSLSTLALAVPQSDVKGICERIERLKDG